MFCGIFRERKGPRYRRFFCRTSFMKHFHFYTNLKFNWENLIFHICPNVAIFLKNVFIFKDRTIFPIFINLSMSAEKSEKYWVMKFRKKNYQKLKLWISSTSNSNWTFRFKKRSLSVLYRTFSQKHRLHLKVSWILLCLYLLISLSPPIYM